MRLTQSMTLRVRARSALTFGGMKGGQARDILLYNKNRVFAFVVALGSGLFVAFALHAARRLQRA